MISKSGEHEHYDAPVGRLFGIVGVTFLIIIALVWRWTDLQVDRFSHFVDLARENQVKLLPIEPPRGRIFDRRGVSLADNKTVFSINVESDFAKSVLGKIDSLTSALAISPRGLAQLRAAADGEVYQGRIVLREQLDEYEVIRFVGIQHAFPEIVLDADLARYYPHNNAAGHVLGYVGRINESDKKRLRDEARAGDYRGSKFIGKTGVELIYERLLRGELGTQEARVDAHGRILSRRIIRAPAPGRDINLSLDWRLQQLAERLLRGESGAAVMMDVDSGELLALASSPRFDGNQFIFGISEDNWRALNTLPGKPLIHRAIYGQYAPGSSIKPFLALAALQHGWRDLDYRYFSRGFFALSPRHIFHDWKEGGHGWVDIGDSIIRSVNTFYYQLGHDVGMQAMRDGLAVFGFGAPTGVALDNEKSGILPHPRWKEQSVGERWYAGDTVAASVGQGYMQATPLQMARAMAVVANGGRRLQPRLLRMEDGADEIDASDLGDAGDGSDTQIVFDEEYLRAVRAALAKVTRPGGTAPNVGRGADYGIAGKTGTAQVSRLQRDASGARIRNENLPKRLRDHAWFVGYAPADSPQVAAAVLVENGGSGGRAAGPIIRQLFDAYLGDSVSITVALAGGIARQQ